MTHKILTFLITSLLVTISTVAATENNDEGKRGIFANWTDEQYKRHDDSIIATLYAPVIENSIDSIALSIRKSPTDASLIKEKVPYYPTIANIDRSKAVGQITINSDISPSGAKLYNVPIQVYPGARNFSPQISLNYNSHNGNSIMGVGWDLSGVPMIKRAGKSVYFDNKAQGVVMDNSDAFVLDGVRLIKTDTNNDCIIYETEHGNIKAIGHITDSIMNYFEVFYPNGDKGIFGLSNNTKNHHFYPIVSLTNLTGSTISYKYTNSDNHYHLERISYNGASVEFKYVARIDTILSYSGGLRIIEPYLLKNITTKLGNTTLGSYSLNYISQNSISLLSQIDFTAGNASLNPLKFHYGEGQSSNSLSKTTTQLSQWYTSEDPNMIKVSKGKFDYDCGAEGLIVLPNKNPYYKHYRHSTLFRHSQNRFDNLFSGDEKIFLYTGLKDNWADAIPDFYTGKGFIDILCADIEGQQEDLVIKINNNVINDKDQVTFKVYRSNLHTGLSELYTRTYNFPTVFTDADGGKSIQPKSYFTGDFNGDGKIEVMAVSVHQPFNDTSKPSKCYVFDLNKNNILFEGHLFAYNVEFVGTEQSNPVDAANNSDRLFVLDYDGDGKTDICHINENGIDIYTFDTIDNNLTAHKVSTYGGLKREYLTTQDIAIGDFNGDGLVDILASNIKRGRFSPWTTHNSIGNGQFETSNFNGPNLSSNDNVEILTQDINGDGLTDLILSKESQFSIYLANSNRISWCLCEEFDTPKSIIIPTSLNSHNCYTKLLCLKDNVVTKYAFSRDDQKENMLTAMTNSFGIVEHNEYNYINDEGILNSLYIKGYDAKFPYVNIQEPIAVLTSSSKHMNGSEIDNISLTYKNAVINRHGRGFCGFEKITITNRRGHTSTRVFDPYNFGVLKQETTPAKETYLTYNTTITENKLAKIRLTNKTTNDLLNEISTSTEYVYDPYGNPTSEITAYSDSTNIRQTYTYFSNATVGDGYYLGFPKNINKYTTLNGVQYIERTYTSSLYKPGLRANLNKRKNTATAERSSYTYDDTGNIITETKTMYGSPNKKTTKYSHDEFSRITQITYPDGNTTSYTYNSTGQTCSITDTRGNITNITYDAFGRETSISYPDGTTSTITYAWAEEPSEGLFSISRIERDGSKNIIVYDGLNREVRNSTTLVDGSVSNIDKQYDAFGNLKKESLPFIGTSAVFWTNYSYDIYDRLLSCTEASGRKTTYSYGANTITSVRDNISKTTEYDVLGNVISVTDPGGKTIYNLSADGQPVSIIAPGGITTRFSYDVYRRRVSLNDPSHGLTTFEYDFDGNLKTIINANRGIIRYKYDTHGHLTNKELPETTFSYDYNSYGQPLEITSTEGYSKKFTYDNFGRVSMLHETKGARIWLKKHYSYANGNIKSIIHESQNGVLVTELYNFRNGHLFALLANDNLIVEVTKAHPYGFPTEIDSNGFNRKYRYTAFGLPTRRTASDGYQTFQDFSYKFDYNSPLLMSRTDETRGITEHFEYDNLNRLSSYGEHKISYDDNGNITHKSDVGSFSYDIEDMPYAVSEIELSSDAVPSMTQDVEYMSTGLPKSITEGNNTSVFAYDENNNRIWMKRTEDNWYTFNTFYLGGSYEYYETPSSSLERVYIGGDYYSAPGVFIRTNQGKTMTYHLLRDYLGSITNILSSEGSMIQELSYDAWGRLRDPKTLKNYAPGEEPDLFIGRGFTGHEHLTHYGLINMNARLYDPVSGRFLSPDPYIQMPDFSQNFNRYSYALNNPLCYVDEDGQFFWAVVGIAAGVSAVINVATHWKEIKSAGGGWNAFMKGAGYFLNGAVAGGVGAAVGIGAAVGFGGMLTATAAGFAAGTTGFYAGAAAGAINGATSGFIMNTSNALLEGEGFGSALDKGLFGAATGGVMGGITGGIAGGIQAYQSGNNFWTGQSPKIQNNTIKLEYNLTTTQNQDTYSGYYGIDQETKEVHYVGITKRPPEVRFNEHLNSGTNRASLTYVVDQNTGNLSKLNARIWEQNAINQFGLMKNGGALYNLRNEISPKYWPKYNITIHF